MGQRKPPNGLSAISVLFGIAHGEKPEQFFERAYGILQHGTTIFISARKTALGLFSGLRKDTVSATLHCIINLVYSIRLCQKNGLKSASMMNTLAQRFVKGWLSVFVLLHE